MSSIKDHLIQCFTAVFPGKTEAEILQANPDRFEEWDSVTAITLLTVIQEEFGVEVEPEDYVELTSFAGILEYLERASGLSHV